MEPAQRHLEKTFQIENTKTEKEDILKHLRHQRYNINGAMTHRTLKMHINGTMTTKLWKKKFVIIKLKEQRTCKKNVFEEDTT